MATPIPTNQAPFGVDEIARATDGRVLQGGPPTVGVFTDSRMVTQGSAFVALTGERFDGHAFLEEVVERGATTLVVSRAAAMPRSVATVLVADTRDALGRLANAHRIGWAAAAAPAFHKPRTVVGITGSAGKTTTKNVLAALLECIAPGTTHASAGNLNNAVGVPMTLLGLGAAHQRAVVELGTSARGEIAALARIAAPDVGVLTLVASAHTENLGSLDDVALEKGALLAALPPEGLAVANGDDPRARQQLARAGARRALTYGFGADVDYRIVERRALPTGARVAIARQADVLSVDSPLLGDAGALALAAALAVAEWLDGQPVPAAIVQAALARAVACTEGRLATSRLDDGTLVIDDSYNANPASMRSSVAAASELARETGRGLVLVLGEMRELGAISESEHRALGAAVQAALPRRVIVVGQAARALADELALLGVAASFAASSVDAEALALDAVQASDVVLVKGSRGVQTERVVAALTTRSRAAREGALTGIRRELV